ncbi:transposase [Mycobacterium sp. 236(2023)]|uniref:transposase n=1 Tax=Mycobacterium sp. 236(2023) TaxID=3038163 RepID=UPI0024151F4A|nr:transposase [Mycobacterium sp. 236(2023)]MDG4664232.1 transposase [Mycobacterium sp. 236(2023)]
MAPLPDKTGLPATRYGRRAAPEGFVDWPARRPQDWRDGVEFVAMVGFTGFNTATAEELPAAATVMDPFQVVPTGQQRPRRMSPPRAATATCGHRGLSTGLLYRPRRTLNTGADLLTDRQKARLAALFAVDAHAEVELPGRFISAPWPSTVNPTTRGRAMAAALSNNVPKLLTILITSDGHSRNAPPRPGLLQPA